MTRQELTDFLAERERASQENALDRWRREVREREAEHARERAQSRERRRLDTAPAPIVDWHAEIAAAVETAIEAERAFLFEVMGTALGESLRDARKESADELASEVRKLWAVLSEMQVTLSALNRIAVTGKGEVLDLPALPRGREIN